MTQVALAKQVLSSGREDAMDVTIQVMATVLDRILLQFEVLIPSRSV